NVQPAGLFDHSIHKSQRFLLVGQIGRKKDGLSSPGLNQLKRLLGFPTAGMIMNADVGPSAGEGHRYRPADTDGAARDQSDSAGKRSLLIHRSLYPLG